jgi:antitoxin component of MazEF toxin-antitoxin module
MTPLKITTVGNSVGIILPKELLEKLRVDQSSRGTMPLTATRTAAAALLSPCVPATR